MNKILKWLLKGFNSWIKISIALIALGLLLNLVLKLNLWKNYPKDNVIEQTCEKVIEKETGITMDFSPE